MVGEKTKQAIILATKAADLRTRLQEAEEELEDLIEGWSDPPKTEVVKPEPPKAEEPLKQLFLKSFLTRQIVVFFRKSREQSEAESRSIRELKDWLTASKVEFTPRRVYLHIAYLEDMGVIFRADKKGYYIPTELIKSVWIGSIKKE